MNHLIKYPRLKLQPHCNSQIHMFVILPPFFRSGLIFYIVVCDMCLTLLILGVLAACCKYTHHFLFHEYSNTLVFSFVVIPVALIAGGVYLMFSFIGEELKAIWRRYKAYVNRTYFPDSPLFKMTLETTDAVIFSTARLLHPLTQINIGGHSILGDSVSKPIFNRGRNNIDIHTGISSEQNSTIGG